MEKVKGLATRVVTATGPTTKPAAATQPAARRVLSGDVHIAAPLKKTVKAPLPLRRAELSAATTTPATTATTTPTQPEELLSPPKDAPGWLRSFWNLMFGNTENKLFQMKVNLIHFKDMLLGFFQVLQSGPLSPLFTAADKVGGVFTGLMARLTGSGAAIEGGAASRLGAVLGRAGAVCGIALKWLERTAPIFGWLVAVQDIYKASVYQGDAASSPDRKALGWITAGLSGVAAIASTLAAWTSLGGVAVLGPMGLSTIAIVGFGLSLLTAHLAKNAR